jgi:hypothetical protein
MPISLHTNFPGGNGQMLSVDESADRPVVRFAAEAKNCPLGLWFHFRVSGLGGAGVRCVLTNPEQTLDGADWSGNCIVYRIGGAEWFRTGRPEKIEVAGGRYEWAWDIDAAGDEIEVAFCFPYQSADSEATLSQLDGAFASATIGMTMAGRQIMRLFNRLPDGQTPAVFLTGRHHAGETPGSWVLDGLLRRVAAEKRLREEITWWAVPFVNFDDVVEGSYGKDPYPCDCNRAYGPGFPRRVEVAAVMADARRLQQAAEHLIFIDLHAPGHNEFKSYVPLYDWGKDLPASPSAQEEFAEQFRAACPEDIRSPVAHAAREGAMPGPYSGFAAQRWAATALKIDAVLLEISYQGNGKTYYTIKDYHRLGAALAETIAERIINRRPLA